MAAQEHGHSRAAWTAVTILLVAAFLISVSVVVASWALAIVGIVLVVVGMAAGKIMAMAGLGQTRPKEPNETTTIR